MTKKLTIEEVEKRFKDRGCELLEKGYRNSSISMSYKCSCGRIDRISINCLCRGQKCKGCRNERVLKVHYYSFEEVKRYFKNHNCILLEKEYKNNNTKMRYQCICNNISKISFYKFKSGQRCKECGKEKIRKDKRLSYKYVYNYFKDNDCELLENEYVNAKIKMRYRCNCGDIGLIKFDDFHRGGRCRKCGIEKISKENSYKWNPNLTNEEREKNKSRSSDPLNAEWRRVVFKKYNYTCQYCREKGGILRAHHIESYNSNEELRLDIDNGTTLCEKHHIEFQYGYGCNNREQYNEFISIGVI